MERRLAPSRRALAGVAALLLVAGLAGCSGTERAGTRTAATVGDTTISQDQVVELMEGQLAYAEKLEAVTSKALEENPEDAEAQGRADQASSTLDQLNTLYGGTGSAAGTDSFGAEGAAQVLSTAIQLELLRDAAREAGVEVPETARQNARGALVDSIKADGVTETDDFEALLDLYGDLQAYQDALNEEFASTGEEREAQLQAAFAESPDSQPQYCINLIATPDEASSRAAFDRVQAGEDFLAVGNEVSVDKDTLAEGQELCLAATQLLGVFPDAATPIADGTILGPVDGQGSWIFVRVVRSTTPSFEDARAQLEQSTPDSAAAARVQEALSDALERVEVTVDPRFGTWDAETGVVEPPSAEPSGTTTTTVASVPADAAGTDPAGTEPAGS